jgi:hypothetical protein
MFPKIAFRRGLGTNTTWYLQSHLKWAHPAGISLAGEPGLIPIERSFATYNRKTNQYLFPGPFLAHAWHGSTIRETHDLIDSDMWRQGKKHF